jgi:peptidoglycan/LPS O-acetylase OafA/YrhL
MMEFKYRPDVDGLRAIAIALVLLFHAELGFAGGFIGVDVFFVISGFLITGLILKELDSGNFSLARFWLRRICRILPNAILMVSVVLIAGFWFLFPSDYKDLAKSAIAQQLMMSNFYFLKNTGYFDGPADLKPLLHTWSLAVEEQFYLIYPLVLIALHRISRIFSFGVLIILCAGSLLTSEYQVAHLRSTSFFLLPSRAWEMLIGGLICFLPLKKSIHPWISETISWTSLFAIIWSGWVYTSNTTFPGFSALLPCGATALLIYSNSLQLSYPAKLLATKPVVFLGKISYSLYLWHWPIFSYYRYWNDAPFGTFDAILLLLLSGLVAILTWRIVETPFRNLGKSTKEKSIFTAAASVCIALLAGSFSIYLGNGFPFRVPTDAVRYADFKNSKKFIIETSLADADRGSLPRIGSDAGEATCILWGDSHAMAFAPGLDLACKNLNISGLQATHSSTPPILNLVQMSKFGLNEKAPIFNDCVLKVIRERDIRIVFMGGFWSVYSLNDQFAETLEATIQEITRNGTKVVVVLDVAKHETDIPRLFAKTAFWRFPISYRGVPLSRHREVNREAEAVIYRICDKNPHAFVLDPAGLFVDTDGFWQACIDGELMVRDESHLTIQGGLRLEPSFRKYLSELSR